MKKAPCALALTSVLAGVTLLLSCGSSPSDAHSSSHSNGRAFKSSDVSLKITPAFIPKGSYGRHKTRRMSPRYITIHSTQNQGSGAGARTHARLLQRGGLTSKHNSLGYLTWHFTVDDHSIYQSLPTNEQGQHADYEGTGNRKSIGIEMCENRGNSRSATLDRTARLAAQLMRHHNIPLRNIVPHQHWEMIRYSDNRNLGHKNCPHFLMTNGRPGAKWDAFIDLVRSHL